MKQRVHLVWPEVLVRPELTVSASSALLPTKKDGMELASLSSTLSFTLCSSVTWGILSSFLTERCFDTVLALALPTCSTFEGVDFSSSSIGVISSAAG